MWTYSRDVDFEHPPGSSLGYLCCIRWPTWPQAMTQMRQHLLKGSGGEEEVCSLGSLCSLCVEEVISL